MTVASQSLLLLLLLLPAAGKLVLSKVRAGRVAQ
jgi:hypothetical protein